MLFLISFNLEQYKLRQILINDIVSIMFLKLKLCVGFNGGWSSAKFRKYKNCNLENLLIASLTPRRVVSEASQVKR